MLTLFRWLDDHRQSYWLIAAVPSTLLVICLVRTLRAEDGTGPLAPRRVDWRYAGLMLLCLLAWRWPSLFVPFDLNPDESWFIAGAITLRHDPVFWRSVDGITSGPLNFYALLPLHWLGLPQSYLAARLTALLLLWGASTGVYALLRASYGLRIARVAILPALVFFALATDTDYQHYSSETLSLLLEGVGVWLVWSYRPRPDDAPGAVRWGWLAGGAVVGLMPWAKLQSAPPALALALWGAWLAFARFEHPLRARTTQIAKLAAATLAPSVIFLVGIAAFGVLDDFYRSYLHDNFTYVEKGASYLQMAQALMVLSRHTWHYVVFLAGVLVVVLAAAIERRMRQQSSGPITRVSPLFALVAFWVVLMPGRGFQHYLLYTVLPLATWAGAAYGDVAVALPRRGARLALAGVFAAVTAVPMLVVRVAYVGTPPIYGHFRERWIDPYDDVGKVLVKYRRDGDTLGLWGWYSHAYVQAQLPQAQRDAQSEHQLRRWPLRDSWFRPRYMAEIRRNLPAIFVDAVGPNAFRYKDRKEWGHETFDELGAFVRENYTLAADQGRARVFVRNDRYAEIEARNPR